MRLLRAMLRLALTGALLWALVVGAMLGLRRELIYPFPHGFDARQISGLPRGEVREITATDGTPLIAWVALPLGDMPVVLAFVGNGGWLPSGAILLREFAHRGFGVAILGYRGAGGAPGSPGQEALVADGIALHDALPRLLPEAGGPPVILGFSLGAALAVQVAARRSPRALVLQTPFAELCEVAEEAYPFLPACLVMWDERWESAMLIGNIDAPILIQHGTEDRIVPFAHGQRLYDAASEPKRFIAYPGGRHNDLRLHGAGQDAIRWLIEEAGALR